MAKYDDWLTNEGLIKVEGWARDGLTDEQIADKIGIKRQTLYDWKKKYSVFSDTLKGAKEVVDRKVENALYRNATGYEYEEVTKEYVYNPVTGEREFVTTKVVTKNVPPNTTAQIFWLKNRKPNEWRDKKQTELTGANGGNLVIGWSDHDKEN